MSKKQAETDWEHYRCGKCGTDYQFVGQNHRRAMCSCPMSHAIVVPANSAKSRAAEQWDFVEAVTATKPRRKSIASARPKATPAKKPLQVGNQTAVLCLDLGSAGRRSVWWFRASKDSSGRPHGAKTYNTREQAVAAIKAAGFRAYRYGRIVISLG